MAINKRILVVEDDEDIQNALKDALSWSGYSVSTASDGELALQALSNDELPAVIFLDLMLPVMDGQEFRAEQIKNPRIASIPTVILSADGFIERKTKALNVNGFLKKPVDLDSLLKIAKEYCGA